MAFFIIDPNPRMQFSLNITHRWITTWGQTGDIFGKIPEMSKVCELCQNWLKTALNLIYFTINPNPIGHFQPNIMKRWIITGDIFGEIAGWSEVKCQ